MAARGHRVRDRDFTTIVLEDFFFFFLNVLRGAVLGARRPEGQLCKLLQRTRASLKEIRREFSLSVSSFSSTIIYMKKVGANRLFLVSSFLMNYGCLPKNPGGCVSLIMIHTFRGGKTHQNIRHTKADTHFTPFPFSCANNKMHHETSHIII